MGGLNASSPYLLCGEKFPDVRAGVEAYGDYLGYAFPGIKSFSLADAKSRSLFENFPPIKEPMRALSVQKSFLAGISSNKPSFVISQGIYGWALGRHKLGFPHINISHGTFAAYADSAISRSSLEYYRTRYIYSLFEKKSAQNADIVVANSGLTKKNLKSYYGVESRVIYNPVDTRQFRPVGKQESRELLGLPEGRKIILFAGRPSHEKGFDIFAKLAESRKEMLFVSVTFPKADISLPNLMCFDSVSREKLNLFYNSADALVFPSLFEGFGFVPLEALACNTPVAAARVGILAESDLEGVSFARDNSAASFQEALDCALENPESRRDFRKGVESSFSLGKFRKEWTSLVF